MTAEAPTADEGWDLLLRHLALVHTLTPDRSAVTLQPSTQTARSFDEARALVWQQVNRTPVANRPARLNALLRRLEHVTAPAWPPPREVLCRTDPNITNFVRRNRAWLSVDWENAGWGDPAYEIADLTMHPSYLSVPAARWEWVIGRYADMVRDTGVERRIRVYRDVFLVWWVARLCRYAYEIPRGLDKQLTDPPTGWLTGIEGKLAHYAEAVEVALPSA